MILSNDTLNKLFVFRKYLHKHPELSKKEYNTAKKIKEFITPNQPDEIIEGIGETGLALVYNGKSPGKTILIRADIDALPIDEAVDFDYASIHKGVSHKCGHDGHTTIVAGLSFLLSQKPPARGRVILLFQPAEETGEGAKLVLDDPKFDAVQPDHVFALHNLPGFETSKIVIRDKHFAAASKGMTIKLFGKTSHAANPELGISPSLAVAEIIQQISGLSASKDGFKDFKLITLIHARIGEIAFGTTPGYAEVRATLRSYRNDDMDYLVMRAIKIVEKTADKFGLTENITWQEEFPATINDEISVNYVKDVANEQNLKIDITDTPFRWSEDFGYFTLKYPGAMFGIGSGKNHPSLHNPEYDFPEEIITTGIKMFYGIIRKILDE